MRGRAGGGERDATVECRGLVHIYRSRGVPATRVSRGAGLKGGVPPSTGLEVVALQGLDLSVEPGEMIAIVGRSGSGKTTLMNILAGLEPPSAGTASVAGWDLGQLDERRRAAYRERVVGYVWQRPGGSLAAELTAFQNVQLPLVAAGARWPARRARAAELIGAVGLRERSGHRPAQLSAGEQQRLALAVALANGPAVLLADEPTAQLDAGTARGILEDLRGLQRDLGLTALIVTHDEQVARYVDRVVLIRDGRTSAESRRVEDGAGSRTEELVILDRAGRLQVPRALLEATGLADRVRLVRHGRGILILPADGGPDEEPAGG